MIVPPPVLDCRQLAGTLKRTKSPGCTVCHWLEGRSTRIARHWTGAPAPGPASVTVLAPSAADADALSTAFYLLGAEAASDYVQKHAEVGIVIVEEGTADRSPRVLTFGITPRDFQAS